MKIKRLLSLSALGLAMVSALTLVSCKDDSSKVDDKNISETDDDTINDDTSNDTTDTSTDDTSKGDTSNDDKTEETTPAAIRETFSKKAADGNIKIYLAGDSTVKTYTTDQYIAGWGQYLDTYLPSSVDVINCAEGGRSSRSFINEGRLYDIDGDSPSFKLNDSKAIADTIDSDDYLFIQFGHNDDDTKAQSDTSYKYERFVPLGTPVNGVYPTVTPNNKQSTTENLPTDMTSSTKTNIAKYGSTYFAYNSDGSNGTYKGYLKEYIDVARERGATPVLVTPVGRVSFNSDGTLKSGPGLHGTDFAYVTAMKQLAEEEDVMLVDLFSDTKNMLETATSTYAHTLMALKPNSLTGTWPQGFDSAFADSDHEATHYNKYGAFVEAAYIADHLSLKNISGLNGSETIKFDVNQTPEAYINPSNLMPKSVSAQIEAGITHVSVTDPTRTYPDPLVVVEAINNLTAVADITNDNYKEVGAAAEAVRAQYNQLNIDDRGSVTNLSTLTAVEAKVAELVEANRPKATAEYNLDCSTLTSLDNLGDYSVVTSDTSKITLSGGAIKLGGNGSASDKHIAITVNGTGTVIITINAYFNTTEDRDAALIVSKGGSDTKSEIVSTGNVTAFTYEFEINGTTTFYIYRGNGNKTVTGILISSISTAYYEN